MFHTNSIRRKLFLGLSLIVGIFAVLAYAGVDGMISYGRLLDDLELSVRSAPRRSDVMAAVATLMDPLDGKKISEIKSHADQAFVAKKRAEAFQATLSDLEASIEVFIDRLNSLPASAGIEEQIELCKRITFNLHERVGMIKLHSDGLQDPARCDQVCQNLLSEVIQVQRGIRSMPDPSQSLHPKLDDAKAKYQSRFRLFCVFCTLSVVIFFLFVYLGYRWIFEPIQTVHQGAMRVSHGDFTYQIDLHSKDEISDLAGVFNQVVRQFNEVNNDLDRKVKEKTRELVRSERLASLGFLSAGVAHEINNPLSAIAMAAESLEYRVQPLLEQQATSEDPQAANDASVIAKYLTMIQSEAFRCREITDRLLNFARSKETAKEPKNVNFIAREVIDMVSHLSQYRDRKVNFETSGDPVAVVNANEIKQVILNILANALEASDQGGKVDVSVKEFAETIEIRIRDYGCGMSAETMEKLFDPFFTNRRAGAGQGTGLGLSICHRIMNDHGGSIEPFSEGAGQGSQFVIRLPKQLKAKRAA